MTASRLSHTAIGNSSSTASWVVTLNAATTAGSKLVLWVAVGDGNATLTGITGGGGTWTQRGTKNDTNNITYIYDGVGLTAGTTTITLAWSAADIHQVGGVDEWAGLGAFEAAGTVGSASSTSFTASYATTNATDVVFGAVIGWPSTTGTQTVTQSGGGWSYDAQLQNGTDTFVRNGNQAATSTGTFTYSGTLSRTGHTHTWVWAYAQSSSTTSFTSAAAALGAVSAAATMTGNLTSGSAALGALTATAALSAVPAPSFVAPRRSQKIRTIVEIAFGFTRNDDSTTWVWVDVTKYVRGQVRIQKAKQNLSQSADPSQINFTLDNTDGRFTPENPNSLYWPNVAIGVPVRVSVTWDGAVAIYERATCFINGWPLQPNAGVRDVTVDIVATGRLRLMRRTNKTVKSSPLRYLSGLTSTLPVASWTFEEGRLASGGTPLYGAGVMKPFVGTHPSGAVVSFPQWGEGNLAPWLPPVVSRSSSSGLTIIWAPVTMPSTPTTWSVDLAYASGSDGMDSTVDIDPIYLSNGLSGWPQLSVSPSDGILSVSFNGLPEVDTSLPGLFDGIVHHLRWTASQSGADVVWTVYLDSVSVNTGTASAFTLPPVRTIGLSAAAGSAQDAIGYVSVWTTAPPVADMTAAILGHQGELATARAARIGAENNIPITVTSGAVAAQAMGPQSADTAANLLAECEDVDGGLLHDGGPNGDLAFISGTARYNAPVAMTLNYLLHHIGNGLAGTFDDENLADEWDISRVDGSKATSVAADSQGFDQQDTVNAFTDDQLQLIGDWRSHVTSLQALRIPSTPIDLRRTPDLAAAVVALTAPARISLINLPSPYPPGSLDVFGDGWVETLDSRTWSLEYVSVPYRPYRVVAVQDPTNPWIIAPGAAALNAGINATAVSAAIKSTDGTLLSTDSADYPCQVEIDGEEVTITSVTGGSSPQTAVIIRSINNVVKSHLANAPVTLYRPAAIAL